MSTSYNPNKHGWGAAVATCVLTGALFFGAWTIHKNTYRHPRDPMAQQVYHERDATRSAGGHTAQTASQGGEPGVETKH